MVRGCVIFERTSRLFRLLVQRFFGPFICQVHAVASISDRYIQEEQFSLVRLARKQGRWGSDWCYHCNGCHEGGRLRIELPLLFRPNAFRCLSLRVLRRSIKNDMENPFAGVIGVGVLFRHSACLMCVPLFFLLRDNGSLSTCPPCCPTPTRSHRARIRHGGMD